MSTSYNEMHVPVFVNLFSGLGRNSVSEAIGLIHANEELDHPGFFLWLIQSVDKVMAPENFSVWIDPDHEPGNVRMVVHPVWWRLIPSPMFVICSRERNGSVDVYDSKGEKMDRRQAQPLFYDSFTDAVKLFHKSMKQHILNSGDITTTVDVIRTLDRFIHTPTLHRED